MLALLLASVALAAEPPVKVERLELVAKGLFETRAKQQVATPGAVMGVVEAVQEKFIAQTDTIEGKPGRQFGCRLKVVGKPKGAPVRVHAVTIFPKPGMLDPRNGKRALKEVIEQDYQIGQTVYHGYEFTYPWEIVPGQWAFEIWLGDKRLSRQVFTVEKPQ